MPKLRGVCLRTGVGRGAFPAGRSRVARRGGLLGSENAGMSSARRVRIPSTECPRFPGEG
ncbi:TPA: hypothetical protein DCL37_06165 [Candidatus Acetothermia bacterium]|nr:hypothetical protein [Candidatus Acetothermia bacterium]